MRKTVNLIFRNDNAGFSIKGVFSDFINHKFEDFEVRPFSLPSHRAKLTSIIANIKYIRNLPKADIYHITGDIHYGIIPLYNKKSVLTIHDTVLLDNCKNPLNKLIYLLFWYIIPCYLAKKVVCISQTTKKRLEKIVHFKSIEVIHNSVSVLFKPHYKEFNYSKPCILHIGTGWNKNLKNTIFALKDLPFFLRIIGILDNETIKLLEMCKINFSNEYNLSFDEIINEYKKCDIVNFPSVFEGFGMPIIEGQAVGRAVITSNIPPMTEIGEDSVCFIDPEDITSLRNAYILCCNNEYRNKLIQKGFENVRKYSFSNFASKYEKLYNSL